MVDARAITCRRRALRRALSLAALASAFGGRGGALSAQEAFPQRALTLLVPFAPGGIGDLTARAVADPLARVLGRSVVVDNRPSAGSIVASQLALQTRADGHTLLLMSNSHALSVSLFRKLPYDVLRDFAPVSMLGHFELGLFVAASSRFGTLRELFAQARERPRRLTIATVAVGSTQHLAAEWFKAAARIDALVVPYRTSPAVVAALRSGEVDLAFEIVGPMLPQLAGGALRALAVTGAQRHAALPEVPTVREQGVAGYVVASWNAIAVAAATPPDRITRLQAALHEALASPAAAQQLGQLGMRLDPGTPAQLRAHLEREIVHWRDVIRAAGIEPE